MSEEKLRLKRINSKLKLEKLPPNLQKLDAKKLGSASIRLLFIMFLQRDIKVNL